MDPSHNCIFIDFKYLVNRTTAVEKRSGLKKDNLSPESFFFTLCSVVFKIMTKGG